MKGKINKRGLSFLLFLTILFSQINISGIPPFKNEPLTDVANADVLDSWYNTAWEYRKPITIESAKVPNTDQTNFPLLVSLIDNSFRTAANGGKVQNANGYDIIFANRNGTVKLDHEVESYDANTGAVIMWVKVPILSHTIDTVIYIYYGNSFVTTSLENKNGVWNDGGSNNYKGVWHMEEDPSGTGPQEKDSTQYANDGTSSGMVSGDSVVGRIGNSLNFDGTSKYLNVGTLGNFGSQRGNNVTMESWVYSTDNAAIRSVMGGGDGTTATGAFNSLSLFVNRKSDSTVFSGSVYPYLVSYYVNNKKLSGATNANNITVNNWHHVVVTIIPSTDSINVYVDGNLQAVTYEIVQDSSLATYVNFVKDFYLGAYDNSGTASSFFKGYLDEARLSVTARSEDWIKTEYNNQSDPVTFYSLGSEENNTSSDPWYNTGWAYRQQITISHNKVSNTDQNNFPVLVSLTNDSLKTVGSGGRVTNVNGYDILFAAKDGSTRLDHEIESYDGSTGTISMWVKIPIFSHTDDTVFYAYYGNSSIIDSLENNGVWDNGFKGIWHLNEDPSGAGAQMKDSTGNGNDGTATGMISTNGVEGRIGEAVNFDGNGNEIINLGRKSSLDIVKNITLETWVSPATLPLTNSSGGVMWKTSDWQNLVSGYGFRSAGAGTSNIQFWIGNGTATSNAQTAIANGWNHIVLTYSSGAGGVIYINGVSKATLSDIGDISTPAADLKLSSTAHPMIMDETRISDTVRSADWIKTEYNNISGSNTFADLFGAEESVPVSTDYFAVTGSASQGVGSSQTITITARDSAGNSRADYSGDKNFNFYGSGSMGINVPTCTDKTGTGVAFGSTTVLTFTGGVAHCDLTVYKSGAATINATSGTYSSAGHTLNINVLAGPVDSFFITTVSAAVSGTAFPFSITAKDVYGNSTTGVMAATTLSVDHGTINPSSIAAVGFQSNGTYSTNVTISGVATGTKVSVIAANGSVTQTQNVKVFGSAEPVPDIYDDFSDGKYQERTGENPWGGDLPEWNVEAGSFKVDYDTTDGYHIQPAGSGTTGTFSIPTDIVNGTWIFKYRYPNGVGDGIQATYLHSPNGTLGLNNYSDGHWWLDYVATEGHKRFVHSGYITNMAGSQIFENLVIGTDEHEVVFIRDERGYTHTWLDGRYVRWSTDLTDDISTTDKFSMAFGDLTGDHPIVVSEIRVYKDKYLPPVDAVTYPSEIINKTNNTTSTVPYIRISGWNKTLQDVATAVNDPSVFSYNASTHTAIAHKDILVDRGSKLQLSGETLLMDSTAADTRKIHYYTDAIFDIENSSIDSVDSAYPWSFSSLSDPNNQYSDFTSPDLNYKDTFRVINSTLNNFGGIYLDRPASIDIEDSHFTNLSGTNPIQVYFRWPIRELTIKNSEFSGKTGTETVSFQGGDNFSQLRPTGTFSPVGIINLSDCDFSNVVLAGNYDYPFYLNTGRPGASMNIINTKTDAMTSNGGSYLRDKYYLDVKVVDQSGNPINGATVTVTNEADNTGHPAENLLTGRIPIQLLDQVAPDGTTQYFRTWSGSVWIGQTTNWIMAEANVNDMSSATTGADGFTPLPSDAANTLVLTKSENNAAYTYTISAAKSGHSATVTGTAPSSSWYRDNPDTHQNTITLTLDMDLPTYSLTVTGGAGTGSYQQNYAVAISANPALEGKIFDRWTGDIQSVANVNNSATTVTMPASSVNLAATYKDIETVATPAFSPSAGTYTSAQTVSISSATSGASIYYTNDGADPTASSTLYSSAITISSTSTIKAIAVKANYIDSNIASATYTINIPSGGGGSPSGGGGGSGSGGGVTSLTPVIVKTEIKSMVGSLLTLDLSVTNASQMMLSDTSSFLGSTWINYSTNPTYTKTLLQTKLYLKFKSSTGITSGIVEIIIPPVITDPSSGGDTSPYPTGTLLKLSDSFKVYVIIGGKKKWISTPEVFEQLGYKWTEIKILTQTELSSIPDYEDNLIRAINDYKVYLVVNGVKRHIPNPIIFLDYGFKWNEVKDVPQETIDKYKPTYLIKQSGSTGIYYVNPQEIRKLIPNTEVFNSYNDKQEDIQIISKTEMDFYPLSNLIKLNGSNDIYLIEGNIKKRIPNPQVFNKYKLNWNLVMSVNQIEFNFYSDGGELK